MLLVGLFYVVSGVLIHPNVFKLVFNDQYVFVQSDPIQFGEYEKSTFPNFTVPLNFNGEDLSGKFYIYFQIENLNQLTLEASSTERENDVQHLSNETDGDSKILNTLSNNAKTELFKKMFIGNFKSSGVASVRHVSHGQFLGLFFQ